MFVCVCVCVRARTRAHHAHARPIINDIFTLWMRKLKYKNVAWLILLHSAKMAAFQGAISTEDLGCNQLPHDSNLRNKDGLGVPFPFC